MKEQVNKIQVLRYFANNILQSDRELDKSLQKRLEDSQKWDLTLGMKYLFKPQEIYLQGTSYTPEQTIEYITKQMAEMSLQHQENPFNKEEAQSQREIRAQKMAQIINKITNVINKHSDKPIKPPKPPSTPSTPRFEQLIEI